MQQETIEKFSLNVTQLKESEYWDFLYSNSHGLLMVCFLRLGRVLIPWDL